MRWLTFKSSCVAMIVAAALLLGSVSRGADEAKPADAKKVAFTAPQQDAVNKLQAKGGLVIPLAANSDALIVSLANGGKQAGDAELELVKQLPKVEQLDLRNTGVTDKGLAAIEGLNDLTMLHLENTAVSDAGLSHLKGLGNLQYLNLFNTAVTDKGVADLSGLKNLKKLYLWQTKVTDAGAAGLKKALPELYVNRGEELAITTQPAQPIAVAAAPAKKPDEKKPEETKPAAVVAAPKPASAVAAAPQPKVDAAIAATVEAAKAAIDAKATEAKAAIDAKAAEAKAAIEKVAQLRVNAAAAAAAAPVAVAKIVNTKCPLSGEAVDPVQFVLFEGKTVGLCCDKCKAKFEADPKKYIDKVVADAK